jgi:hypothetical protein
MAFRSILTLLIATAIGSTLPEFGDVLAVHLKIAPHFFNPFFLFIGIVGIVLACFVGRKRS